MNLLGAAEALPEAASAHKRLGNVEDKMVSKEDLGASVRKESVKQGILSHDETNRQLDCVVATPMKPSPSPAHSKSELNHSQSVCLSQHCGNDLKLAAKEIQLPLNKT